MTEIQEKYNLGIATIEGFNPSQFGTIYDGSFNGIIYKSFCGKFTYKQSNNYWVIYETSNTPAKNITRFRGKIKSNEFARDLFESFEVKE